MAGCWPVGPCRGPPVTGARTPFRCPSADIATHSSVALFVGPRMRSRPRPNFTFLSSLCVNIMEFAEGSSPRAGPRHHGQK
jgi:hypothetical protein